ncbi:uncharacterized protein NPIL_63311, partial [Nephila pilipes]
MHRRERGFPAFPLIDCGIPFHPRRQLLRHDSGSLIPNFRTETPISAVQTLYRNDTFDKRCTSFQNVKRGEICKVPGSTVSPAPPGTPTPIRLPHAKPDVFREVLFYLYTGK